MKNSADLGVCYSPRLSASVDNTLLDLQNFSYPTQPHSIIANSCISNVVLRVLYTACILAKEAITCLYKAIEVTAFDLSEPDKAN